MGTLQAPGGSEGTVKLLSGVNVVSLTVTDLTRARDFYSNVLGLGQPWFDDESLGWIEWGERGKKRQSSGYTSP